MLKKPDKYFWIANIVIVLSLLIFFSRSLFTNRILASGDFETYPFFVSQKSTARDHDLPLLDPIDFFIPMIHLDRQTLKNGKLPLWNPYQGCGVPNMANLQSAVFFPLNIFVYAFNWKWGLFFLYFFKLYFIGLFLFLYLREIDISPQVATAFSVAGIFMSFNITVLYDAFSNAAFFFPMSLWAIELTLKQPKQFKGYLILCIGLILALFGGNPEAVFYGTFVLIVYLFTRLYQIYKWNIGNGWLPVLSRLFAISVLAILISSIQLLPFLEYFRLSSAYISRNILELQIRSIPVYILLFSILPTVTVSNLGILIAYVFNKYQTMATVYPGVSIMVLGIAGIIALHKDKFIKSFILILILSLCMGFYVPYLHNLIIKIPGFNVGRNYYMAIFIAWSLLIIGSKTLDSLIDGKINLKPVKISFLIILGLIIIFGAFFITRSYPSLPSSIKSILSYYLALSITVTIVIMILTLFVLKIKNKTWLLIVLGILIYAQTALPMIFIEPAIKPEYFYPNNKIFSLLNREKDTPFRVTALISNTLPIAYPTNINTFYNIEDIRNYDSMGVNWYNSIFSYIAESDALNLTNVKYIIVKCGYDLSNLTNIFQPVTRYNDFILYKNFSVFNRAFMVYNFAIADTDQQALNLLHTYSGQLNKVAVVFKNDIQGMPMTAGMQETSAVTFIKYTPMYIKLSCTTSQPGLFFISDTYFPGWHARVDGKKTKIIRADYAFQGLWLTQGTHTIELNYDPASFKFGALLSIIGILSLIGFYFIVFRTKKDDKDK